MIIVCQGLYDTEIRSVDLIGILPTPKRRETASSFLCEEIDVTESE